MDRVKYFCLFDNW